MKAIGEPLAMNKDYIISRAILQAEKLKTASASAVEYFRSLLAFRQVKAEAVIEALVLRQIALRPRKLGAEL